jgi:hypothetical protein
MSERNAAKEFFDELERNDKLQAKIKLGLESLVKIAADYDVTEEELSAELRKRWNSQILGIPYSEPPGF